MSTDGTLPTIVGTPEFKRGDKGYGITGFTTGDRLQYAKAISNGTYSVVIWARHHHATAGFVDLRTSTDGVGYAWISGTPEFSVSSGTQYVNNVSTRAVIQDKLNFLVVTGITLESTQITLNALWSAAGTSINGNMPYIAIYEGTLTSAERDELYQDFLNAPATTSMPTVIRPIYEI